MVKEHSDGHKMFSGHGQKVAMHSWGIPFYSYNNLFQVLLLAVLHSGYGCTPCEHQIVLDVKIIISCCWIQDSLDLPKIP